ncbi:DUF3311 domain-containing protein [Acidisoma sp.]|uniref:DUF3311 domain-containing protein n=1 Tax=Acidisoma sp. TaxID=1872115 RepID=UPI003AFF8C0A
MLPRPPQAARPWRLLLLIPVLAVLAVPVFNRTGPALWGFPFFYWYQMLWVILCSGAAGLVFLLENRGGHDGEDA